MGESINFQNLSPTFKTVAPPLITKVFQICHCVEKLGVPDIWGDPGLCPPSFRGRYATESNKNWEKPRPRSGSGECPNLGAVRHLGLGIQALQKSVLAPGPIKASAGPGVVPNAGLLHTEL